MHHLEPVSQSGSSTKTELSPTADELGCGPELDGITSLVEHGTSAEAQRRVFRETGDLSAVVRHLVDELERP